MDLRWMQWFRTWKHFVIACGTSWFNRRKMIYFVESLHRLLRKSVSVVMGMFLKKTDLRKKASRYTLSVWKKIWIKLNNSSIHSAQQATANTLKILFLSIRTGAHNGLVKALPYVSMEIKVGIQKWTSKNERWKSNIPKMQHNIHCVKWALCLLYSFFQRSFFRIRFCIPEFILTESYIEWTFLNIFFIFESFLLWLMHK